MNFRFDIRIGSILRIAVIAFAKISLIGYLGMDASHPYIDTLSIKLILSFALVLFVFSGRFATKYPTGIFLTILLIMFVQSRLCVLIFLPDSLLHHAKVTSFHLNSMLVFMIGGTFAAYLGCAAGHLSLTSSIPNLHWQTIDGRMLNIILSAFWVSVVFTVWVYLDFGFSGSTGSGSHLGFFQRYIARLVDPALWLIMLLSAYMLHPIKGARVRVVLGAFTVYLLFRMLQGSRAGIFEGIMLILAAKIFFDGNFTFTVKGRYVLMVVFAPIIALLTYQIPTALRAHWYNKDYSIMHQFGDMLSGEESIMLDRETISGISYRLSFIEPTMFTMHTLDLDLHDVSNLVNLQTTTLSSINRVIPGKPLGNILFTEYAFGFMYDNVDGILAYSEDGRVDRVAYEWSIFGISYQLFGHHGGWFFIFIITAILVKLIRITRDMRNIYGAAFGIYFTGIYVVWIRNLGIDNLVDRAVHGFAILLIYAIICWGIKHGSQSPKRLKDSDMPV